MVIGCLYLVYYKKAKQLAAHTIGGQNPGSVLRWLRNNEKETSIGSHCFFHLNRCLPLSINSSSWPACLLMVLTTLFHQAECHREMARKGPQMGTIDGRVTHLMSKEKWTMHWTKAIHFFAVLLRQIIHVCLISANFLWHEENHMIRLDPWSI